QVYVAQHQDDILNYFNLSTSSVFFDNITFLTFITQLKCHNLSTPNLTYKRFYLYHTYSSNSERALIPLIILDLILLFVLICICVTIVVIYILVFRQVKRSASKNDNSAFKKVVNEIRLLREASNDPCTAARHQRRLLCARKHLFEIFAVRRTDDVHVLFPDDFRIDVEDQTKLWQLVLEGQRQEDRIRLQPRAESPI
ncbi:hypothetical protein Tcan_13564, partial [Toxocara canis]